jgi:site-specific recombinase XerD
MHSLQRVLSDCVEKCLAAEENRRLSTRSMAALRQHYTSFIRFCTHRKIVNILDLTPAFLEDFVHSLDSRKSPALTKAVAWALRELGAFLALC